MAETSGLLNRRALNGAPRVRIPASPPIFLHARLTRRARWVRVFSIDPRHIPLLSSLDDRLARGKRRGRISARQSLFGGMNSCGDAGRYNLGPSHSLLSDPIHPGICYGSVCQAVGLCRRPVPLRLFADMSHGKPCTSQTYNARPALHRPRCECNALR